MDSRTVYDNWEVEIMKFVMIFLGITLWLDASMSYACPGYLPAKSILPQLSAKRSHISAFAIQSSEGHRRWIRIPVQIDPLDEDGILSEGIDDKSAANEILALSDRLVLNAELFGPKMKDDDPSPCSTSAALIELHGNRGFAYLASCAEIPSSGASPIHHNPDQRMITGPFYEYQYLESNQLIWEKFFTKSSLSEKTTAINQAAMVGRFDFRNFLALNFDNSSIESYVESVHHGELGMVSRIQFYLRMLFLKIQIKMATSASFYADSANIPMDLDFPGIAESALNPESGVFLNWINGRMDFDPRHSGSNIPLAEPAISKSGSENMAKIGLRQCKNQNPCVFRLTGQYGTESLTIDLNIPRYLVEHGYFPMWVEDAAEFRRQMGWNEQDDAQKRVGIYLDTQGIPAGKHRMELWLHFKKPEATTQCPSHIEISSK